MPWGRRVLLLLGGLAGAAGQGQASLIAVSNGAPWGDWAWPDMCPQGSYASGVSFKVEAPQGAMGDDTALNGVRLHCFHGGDSSGSYTAQSQSGRWGRWSEPRWCPRRGRLLGFALRVQAPRHGLLSDEVAARFTCSGGPVLEGPGSPWGQWGDWSPRCRGGVCGIQTRQEPARGLRGDDTALNDLRLFCCP